MKRKNDEDQGAPGGGKVRKQAAGEQLTAAKAKKKAAGAPAAGGATAAPGTLTAAQKKHIPQSHKEQLALKAERRRFENPTKFQVITEAKAVWEKARAKSIAPADRAPLIDQLMGIIAGKAHDVIFQHDSARIVQTCLQYGSPAQRATLLEELLPHVVELAKSKYAKFVVPKMLEYCAKEHKTRILAQFHGHVRKLIKHTFAGPVLALAYADFASPAEKMDLIQELYGPEFGVFKLSGVKTLEELFELHPDKKPSILKHLRDTLNTLMDKGKCTHHIVHRGLLEFLTHASDVEAVEMANVVKDLLVEMLHTKDGAACTVLALARSTPKERKHIVKTFKNYVSKIAFEEFGHTVLLAIFDLVDDTVVVKKSIIAPLVECLEPVLDNTHGRKVLAYLIAHRSLKHFTPEQISTYSKWDSNPHTKKDAAVRIGELRGALLPGFFQFMAAHPSECMRGDPQKGLVVAEAMLLTAGEASGAAAMTALASLATDTSEDGLLNNGPAHRVFKLILQGNPDFCAALHGQVAGRLQALAQWNRAAFVLVSLVENAAPATIAAVKAELGPHTDALIASELPGSVLLAKLVLGQAIQPRGAARERTVAAGAAKPAKARAAKKATTAAAAAAAKPAKPAVVAAAAAATKAKPTMAAVAKAKAARVRLADDPDMQPAADDDDDRDDHPASAAPPAKVVKRSAPAGKKVAKK